MGSCIENKTKVIFHHRQQTCSDRVRRSSCGLKVGGVWLRKMYLSYYLKAEEEWRKCSVGGGGCHGSRERPDLEICLSTHCKTVALERLFICLNQRIQ